MDPASGPAADNQGRKMKILITGICGFVGSSLAETLLQRHHDLSHLRYGQSDASGLGDQSYAASKASG